MSRNCHLAIHISIADVVTVTLIYKGLIVNVIYSLNSTLNLYISKFIYER